MFVDSHCHLDFPELSAQLDELLSNMAANQVTHALCISVSQTDWPRVMATAEPHANLYATVGVHPEYPDEQVDESYLLERAQHKKVLAIGETGLDYYRLTGDLEWQRERFRTHIRAARASAKPLVIHTRAASADTLRIMQEERAAEAGGVMHCFTETLEVARAAMEMGFYISFSGIVSFKNAHELRAVAKQVPLDRMLIETDSPYLAPVPFRGKTNQPAYVKHVAEALAQVRGVPVEQIAQATTQNFFELFRPPQS
jgi:TatD DNase family protein